MIQCNTDAVVHSGGTQTPLASQLNGPDRRSAFLFMGYSEYAILSLQGCIDPDFLQENVRIRHDCFCQRDGRCDGDNCIGILWAQEVDEERKRIDSM
mmetsp:Transcript_24880/g.44792  ORF Transcript_24880/g.44792 Transcript_24880/m.44792 type:complete len:97 (-) Transcript_24880:483-773(-)